MGAGGGGGGKEKEGGMPKLKAHAEKLFFFPLNLADVCWKSQYWEHGNVKPTGKTEPRFLFFSPGTLSRVFRMLRGDSVFTLETDSHWLFLARCQRASLTMTLNPVEVAGCFAIRFQVVPLPREHTFRALMYA